MKEVMATQPVESRPHERMRKRILALKVGLIVFFLLLAARLVQIQVERRNTRACAASVRIPGCCPQRGDHQRPERKILVSNAMMVSFVPTRKCRQRAECHRQPWPGRFTASRDLPECHAGCPQALRMA
jgi:hypothetical protein